MGKNAEKMRWKMRSEKNAKKCDECEKNAMENATDESYSAGAS